MASRDSVDDLIAQALDLVTEMETLQPEQVSSTLVASAERLQSSLCRADQQLANPAKLRREIRQVCDRLDRLLREAQLRNRGTAPAPETIANSIQQPNSEVPQTRSLQIGG